MNQISKQARLGFSKADVSQFSVISELAALPLSAKISTACHAEGAWSPKEERIECTISPQPRDPMLEMV